MTITFRLVFAIIAAVLGVWILLIAAGAQALILAGIAILVLAVALVAP